MLRAVLDTNILVSAMLNRQGAPAQVFQLLLHDPDDDVFLACAQAAGARYVITGNTRHFPDHWRETQVVTARRFLDLES